MYTIAQVAYTYHMALGAEPPEEPPEEPQAATDLYALPDGPLAIVLENLMCIDPTTLVGVVALLGTRLPIICHNHITLKLKPGWYNTNRGVTPGGCVAGIRRFRWKEPPPRGSVAYPSTLTSIELMLYVLATDPTTDVLLAAAASCCPSLEALKVPHRKDQTLAETFVHGNLIYTDHRSHYCLKRPTDLSIIAIAFGCPRLASFNIRWEGPTDSSLIAIAAGCPRLTTLDVAHCNVTDASIIAIAAGCPRLTTLDVSYCSVSDVSIIAIAAGCPQLTTLDVEGCSVSDVSIIAIAAGCPQLTTLDVEGCSVSNASIIAIAAGCPDLMHLTIVNCRKVTDVSFIALATGCPKLRFIDARGCLTPTGATAVAVRAGQPALISLTVGTMRHFYKLL
jgi:hypothetical protein